MIHGETKSNEEFMIFPSHRIPTSTTSYRQRNEMDKVQLALEMDLKGKKKSRYIVECERARPREEYEKKTGDESEGYESETDKHHTLIDGVAASSDQSMKMLQQNAIGKHVIATNFEIFGMFIISCENVTHGKITLFELRGKTVDSSEVCVCVCVWSAQV